MADRNVLSEADAAAARARLRSALKNEFQKKITHPYRHGMGEGGYMFDPAVQRFMSMKASGLDYFKVTPKTTFYGIMLALVPFVGMGTYLDYQRAKNNQLYSTGQVAYKDRQFKFH